MAIDLKGMSLKLTTSLSQRLVLTPQLRQRIEMLQMTSLELSDLIQQQLAGEPCSGGSAEPGRGAGVSEKVLDHLASSDAEAPFGEAPEPGAAATNGSGDLDAVAAIVAPEGEMGETIAAGEGGEEETARSGESRAMLLKRSISDASFRTTSIPDTRLRRSSTRKTRLLSNSF